MSDSRGGSTGGGAVFVMANTAGRNQVLGYDRDSAGQLHLVSTCATGGAGTGEPHLSSQGSVVLTDDERFLLVSDGGSDEVSVLRVRGTALELVDVQPSGGEGPSSTTVHGDLVYVLNKGGNGVGSIGGFRLGQDGRLAVISGSQRPLSAAGSNPAQVAITPDGGTVVVTEEATNRIGTWPLGADGRAGAGAFTDAAGRTPFGFAITRDGTLVVANAEAGGTSQASASSYRIGGSDVRVVSGPVRDLRTAACWAVLGADQRYAYLANFGDGTLSSCTVAADGTLELLESVAATTTPDQPSVRDAGTTRDGRYLYAIDVTSQSVHGWAVGGDGRLTPVGAFPGLPVTAAGLAAA